MLWFTTGATAGFGGAMWIRRRVLRTLERYTPPHVQHEVATSVRRLGSDVRDALSEGRRTMAEREAELRAELRPGAGGLPQPCRENTHVSPRLSPLMAPRTPAELRRAWSAFFAARQHTIVPSGSLIPTQRSAPLV